MENLLLETYSIALPIVLTALMGYIVWLLKKQKKDLGNKLLDVVNALFAVLTILGIVVDPTTAGTGDSVQAMTYTEPKRKDDVK